MTGSTIKHEIALMDFIRGWTAIFVFFHHSALLGGGPKLITGNIGQEAVNAFMLSSGFLIYYQVKTSKTYEELRSWRGILNFYIRRFFRIAPAYYFTLIFALVFSYQFGVYRQNIMQYLPGTAPTAMSRYFIKDYFTNILAHISFTFGLHPHYAYSTPLPDWSLGLEMQFYFVFPFIFFLLKRNFMLFFVSIYCFMYSLYLSLQFLDISFPMPSFLPLKFHNFAAGIALSYLFLNNKNLKSSSYSALIILTTLIFLWLGNKSFIIPVLFLFCYWFLIGSNSWFNSISKMFNFIFSHKSSKFLAEISYSVYIIHLLLLLPFFGIFLKYFTVTLSTWFLCSFFLLSIVILAAYFSYKYVELPGIALGKILIERNVTRKQSVIQIEPLNTQH